MTALSHPRRVAIFDVLIAKGRDGLAFEALQDAMSLRPSSLAHHIRPMEAAGVVRRKRKGAHVLFSIHGSAFRAIAGGVAERLR